MVVMVIIEKPMELSIYDDAAPQKVPLHPDTVVTVQLTIHEISHILRCMYAFRFARDYHTVHESSSAKLEKAAPTH